MALFGSAAARAYASSFPKQRDNTAKYFTELLKELVWETSVSLS